jgi:NAD-dependent deacetylase
MIVVGTSAMVNPVAELPGMAQRNRARVIEVNKDKTPLSSYADLSFIGSASEILPQLATQPENLSTELDMDLGKAIMRGLEKFYMKHPQLVPDDNKLPETAPCVEGCQCFGCILSKMDEEPVEKA